MKTNRILLSLLGLVLTSCSFSGGGSSGEAKSSRPDASRSYPPEVAESAFESVVDSVPQHSFATAKMTAFYVNVQGGETAIDEVNKTCTYIYDEGNFDVNENKLGQYTSTFVNAINEVTANRLNALFPSLIRQLELANPQVHYYLEGGIGASLTGKFDAHKLDAQITGTFDFRLDLSFNEYGLITAYDSHNQGMFAYEGHEFDYNDNNGFVVTYAA